MAGTRTAARQTPQEDRLARARAALGAAERSAARWGGRIDRTALSAEAPSASGADRSPGGRGGPRGLVPAPVPAPVPPERLEQPAAAPDAHSRRPLPAALAPLVPYGSLRAGSSVAVTGTGSTSLLLALASAAAGTDAWCAIAGMPDLGLRAALDAGLDPCRLAILPDAGEQRAQVLSALVDGVGVVLLGAELPLTPALWRTLLGRARTHDTLVLAATPPGRADLHLQASCRGWTGLSAGSGRLRRRRLAITSEGRGIAGQREAEVLLPQVRGMIEAVPSAVPDVPAAPVAAAPLRAVRRAG